MTSRQQDPAGLVDVGYEGRPAEELITQLHALGVSRIADVRLTPLSRKRGQSKTARGQALQAAGIVHEHRRELGNPKDNRPGFAGASRNQARTRYAELQHQPQARMLLALAHFAGVTGGRG